MKAFIVAGAILIGLFICEGGARLVGISYPVFVQTDPVRGVAHIPGAHGWYTREGRAWVAINRDGLRGPDIELKKAPGTLRIALLGDSYVAGFQVAFAETFGEVIRQHLSDSLKKPVEVLNFGVGGYGTSQELLTLDQVWQFEPDLVLLGFLTGNNVSDNHRALKRVDYVPYHVFEGDDLRCDTTFLQSAGYLGRSSWTSRSLLAMLQHSRLVQVGNEVRYRWRSRKLHEQAAGAASDELGLDQGVYVPPSSKDWVEAWHVTEGLLRLMRDGCGKHKIPFAIATLTNGIQVDPRREKREKAVAHMGVGDLYYPDRRLAAFGQSENIRVLNLAPIMLKQAEARQVYFHGFGVGRGSGHWNQEGHRVAGELVASWAAEWLVPATEGSR